MWMIYVAKANGNSNSVSSSFHDDTMFSKLGSFFDTTLRPTSYSVRLKDDLSLKYTDTSNLFIPFKGGIWCENLLKNIQLSFSFSVNLFTPNTFDLPAETKGQIEEYKKALKEEATELEKEKNLNTLYTESVKNFEESPKNLRNYVNVRSSGFNYSYFT